MAKYVAIITLKDHKKECFRARKTPNKSLNNYRRQDMPNEKTFLIDTYKNLMVAAVKSICEHVNSILMITSICPDTKNEQKRHEKSSIIIQKYIRLFIEKKKSSAAKIIQKQFKNYLRKTKLKMRIKSALKIQKHTRKILESRKNISLVKEAKYIYAAAKTLREMTVKPYKIEFAKTLISKNIMINKQLDPEDIRMIAHCVNAGTYLLTENHHISDQIARTASLALYLGEVKIINIYKLLYFLGKKRNQLQEITIKDIESYVDHYKIAKLPRPLSGKEKIILDSCAFISGEENRFNLEGSIFSVLETTSTEIDENNETAIKISGKIGITPVKPISGNRSRAGLIPAQTTKDQSELNLENIIKSIPKYHKILFKNLMSLDPAVNKDDVNSVLQLFFARRRYQERIDDYKIKLDVCNNKLEENGLLERFNIIERILSKSHLQTPTQENQCNISEEAVIQIATAEIDNTKFIDSNFDIILKRIIQKNPLLALYNLKKEAKAKLASHELELKNIEKEIKKKSEASDMQNMIKQFIDSIKKEIRNLDATINNVINLLVGSNKTNRKLIKQAIREYNLFDRTCIQREIKSQARAFQKEKFMTKTHAQIEKSENNANRRIQPQANESSHIPARSSLGDITNIATENTQEEAIKPRVLIF